MIWTIYKGISTSSWAIRGCQNFMSWLLHFQCPNKPGASLEEIKSVQPMPDRHGRFGKQLKHTSVLSCFLMTLSPIMFVCLAGTLSALERSVAALVPPLWAVAHEPDGSRWHGGLEFISLPFLGLVPTPTTPSRRRPSALYCSHPRAKRFSPCYWHNFISHYVYFPFHWEINIVTIASACFWVQPSHRGPISLCPRCCLKQSSKRGQAEVRNHCHLQKYFSSSSV